MLNALANDLRRIWAPLGDHVAFRLERDGEAVGMGDTLPFEVGSAFKAIVAAATCQAVADGRCRWDDHLLLEASWRVPSSDVTAELSNGSHLSLREAAEAMLAVSDNTATDMVLRAIGVEAVRTFMAEAGLVATRIPDSVGAVYATATDDWAEACITTMEELVRFYRQCLYGDALSPVAQTDFETLMLAENTAQGTDWGPDTTCLRKSGNLEPPPWFVQAMAGVMQTPAGTTIFAMALNMRRSDPELPAEQASCFVEGVRHALVALAR